ncbi:probable lysophospholipase BODYGUARD 1 [Andrographis paniculata]|uniref:probable lysophospholipase BODYGUARD 1 n=1 Tax=Andrographis paniculata TaxID=175694 RepID=UPI0021E847AE|nr:probable lysophospholipase BODYGUARD 1 [Andrographis paniculata]
MGALTRVLNFSVPRKSLPAGFPAPPILVFWEGMGIGGGVKSVLAAAGGVLNRIASFIVFILLDILDFLLCYAYKAADILIESEWKPCYCCSPKEAIAGAGGKIFVSEQRESRVVRLTCCSKLQLEEVSDTLYARPSLVSEVSQSTIVEYSSRRRRPSYTTVNSTVVEMLQGRINRKPQTAPRWSDCDCETCHSWSSSSSCKETLFVRADGAKDNVQEDVVFIHGFISSSSFWTETLYPNFSKSTKSKYRLLAVDLLGFGRSPKPADSLYTLREHLERIERSVLEAYKVESFHIVAHSLGCILALALAVKHPASVKSLTLLAPPYFPIPKGQPQPPAPAQYMMRRVAPRRVWPPIAFGAAVACWYEHLCRTACLLVCKNHRLVESLVKLFTRNRMRTYLIECFFLHTHHAAWHTLHNVICGTAGKIEGYLDDVRDRLKCDITIFHGEDDELIPVECSYNVQSRIPRAHVKVVQGKDHLTIVVGRQKAFARELESIWESANG